MIEIAARNSRVHQLQNDTTPVETPCFGQIQGSAFADASYNLLDSYSSVHSAKTFHIADIMVPSPTRSARLSGSSVWDFDEEECLHDEVHHDFGEPSYVEVHMDEIEGLTCPKSPDRCKGFNNRPLRPGSARTTHELKLSQLRSGADYGMIDTGATGGGGSQPQRPLQSLDDAQTSSVARPLTALCVTSSEGCDWCNQSGSIVMEVRTDWSMFGHGLSMLKFSTTDLDLDVPHF